MLPKLLSCQLRGRTLPEKCQVPQERGRGAETLLRGPASVCLNFDFLPSPEGPGSGGGGRRGEKGRVHYHLWGVAGGDKGSEE